jgi:hypothetical protein
VQSRCHSWIYEESLLRIENGWKRQLLLAKTQKPNYLVTNLPRRQFLEHLLEVVHIDSHCGCCGTRLLALRHGSLHVAEGHARACTVLGMSPISFIFRKISSMSTGCASAGSSIGCFCSVPAPCCAGSSLYSGGVQAESKGVDEGWQQRWIVVRDDGRHRHLGQGQRTAMALEVYGDWRGSRAAWWGRGRR